MTPTERAALISETVQRMKAAVLDQLRSGSFGPQSLDRICRDIEEGTP